MSCEHLRTAIGAYALGALDPDEAAAIRRHLEDCEKCRAEYDELAPLPGLLSLADGAEEAVEKPLSPAFEERLLDAFARDRASSPRRRLRWRLPRRRWLAVGAVGLAAIAAAAVGVTLLDDDGPPARRYALTFQNVNGPPSAQAAANLESSDAGTRVHLIVRGLARDPDAVYEVLCDAEEWTATAGTFRTDAEGKAYVIVTTALRKSEYNAIRIVRRGLRTAPPTRRTSSPRSCPEPSTGGPRRSHMRRMTWILTLLLSAALLVAGCGGDDGDGGNGGGGGGGGEALTLTADSGGAISWEPGKLSTPAGRVTIKLVNESDVPHAVEVEGNGVEEESKTVTGGETELSVDLEPGTYEYYCPVDGHKAQGMEGTLTVE